jgi:hypothetical protein
MTQGTQINCHINVYPTLVQVTTSTLRPGQKTVRWSEQGEFNAKLALDELPALQADVQGYGRRLFNLLFPPGSKTLSVFHGIDPKADVTVIVEINDDLKPLGPDLCNLRWEYLCAEEEPNDVFLARSFRFRLVRRLHSLRSTWVERPALEGLPRVLAVVANPTNSEEYSFKPIEKPFDPVQTNQLLETFDGLRDDGLIADYRLLRAPFLPGQESHPACIQRYPSPDCIHDVLRDEGPFHILHFLAHGSLDEHGKGHMLLTYDDGKANLVRQDQLDTLFPHDHQVRLVMFATCHSGEQMVNQPLAGLAPSVLQVGVPAVIAMQDQISKRTAAAFTSMLYRELAETGMVDTAVVEARREVFRKYPKESGWAVPVLYLQNDDPRLFVSKKDVQQKPTEPESTPRPSPFLADPVTAEENRAHLEELLAIHQRSLHHLRKQKAVFAIGEEPLRLITQIEHEEREIERVKAELAQLA